MNSSSTMVDFESATLHEDACFRITLNRKPFVFNDITILSFHNYSTVCWYIKTSGKRVSIRLELEIKRQKPQIVFDRGNDNLFLLSTQCNEFVWLIYFSQWNKELPGFKDFFYWSCVLFYVKYYSHLNDVSL